MSKYYKAEDVIREIEEMPNCYNGWSDTYDKAQIIGVLADLPTIEVNEDKEIELGAMLNGSYKLGFEHGKESVEVSGDCISREYVKGICEDMLDEEMLGHMLGRIEHAPSVLPKRSCYRCGLREDCEDSTERKPKEGEWIPCTKEGLPLTELMRREGKKWYGYRCTNCNFIYKGNALTESRYCQGCGAKMRGAEE